MAIQKLVSVRSFAIQDCEPCWVVDGLYLGALLTLHAQALALYGYAIGELLLHRPYWLCLMRQPVVPHVLQPLSASSCSAQATVS